MSDNLQTYWDSPVSTLAARHEVELAPEEQERRRIYALTLMAITAHFWNGNKLGPDVRYPLNPAIGSGPSVNLRGAYIGHNIASLAVAGDGEIIDFEFNHNEIFNSSIEHAEARMLRRVFSLHQISDSWDVDGHSQDSHYGTLLSKVSIYTTLESCSQCSGIMTLAGVKEVIYLQTDPQMYHIGDILRRLSKREGSETYLQAPLPIAGRHIGLDAFTELDRRYQAFADAQTSRIGEPFATKVEADGSEVETWSASVTSFLCTAGAYEVFASGEPQLRDLEREHSSGRGHGLYCPAGSTRSNKSVVREALDFLAYVEAKGLRATPHKT